MERCDCCGREGGKPIKRKVDSIKHLCEDCNEAIMWTYENTPNRGKNMPAVFIEILERISAQKKPITKVCAACGTKHLDGAMCPTCFGRHY